ncbi:ribosomal protection-like ABC-F family protein [Helicovermis profundi]|uniref:ABC-F type ribosomal protection protein n=1 Tax=Helicovermis profundi TaxID=3065157 RepID=A0AAU9E6T8_9FIRM|nr:ABC-F type ribosomal protection protein [Clostridia bacterium S502]
MIELSIKNLKKSFGANEIFSSISFELHRGARIGLIGRNGCGKTTIFKIIAGIISADDGIIALRNGVNVGYLDQIPSFENHKVLDVLRLAFKKVFEIDNELKKIEMELSKNSSDYDKLLKEYGEKQLEFERTGGYRVHEQIEKICSGFKFTKDFLNMDFEILSGGEKTRVILAKILLEKPQILLLDEPSNHLDIESVEWLEDYLIEYDGSVIIISHDRYFLDKAVSEIYEIENGEAYKYLGNYSYYINEKERRTLEQIEKYELQQKKIKDMEDAIKRFKDWGTRADNEQMFVKARNMQKRIEKMDKVNKPKINNKKIALEFNESERSGKDVLEVEAYNKSFDKKIIFKNANMNIKYKDYVALLGKNGSGKSTLIKEVMNLVNGKNEKIKLSKSVNIGYMEQEIKFDEPKKNILDTFKEKCLLSEFEARHKLARFLFYGEDVFKKIENLSGGEKVRLSLCIMMEKEINFLVLDEPTNHVDIESREMIENALMKFNGTLFFISHDRYFINKLANKIIEIDNYKLNSFNGDYEYYRSEKLKNIEKQKNKVVKEKKQNKKINKITSVKNNKNVNSKKIQLLEINIEKIENKIKNLENEMIENSTNSEKLISIQNEINSEKLVFEELMIEWMKYQA